MTSMNDLVIMRDQQALTTSLKVAEKFKKAHKNVLQSIKNLTAENSAVKNMFAESTNEFEIPRYDCLKAKDFNEAMKFTKNWYPSFVLQREIQNINAQTRLDFEDRG